MNGIGGKSVIIIRFNPDKIKNREETINIKLEYKLEMLVKIIKEELIKEINDFKVELIQLYYNDDNENYNYIKKEEITDRVCI